MLFTQAIPPGPGVTPEDQYTHLNLSQRAGGARPYVVCNFVSSADGKATADGRTAGLGSEGDRTVFHLLRTQVDGLLAGTETMRIERYGLPVRAKQLSQLRVADGRAPQPVSVVISRSGNVPFEIPLFAEPRAHVALYAPPNVAAAARACRARVTHHVISTGVDSLTEIMRSLRHDHHILSLLCEGGPALFNSLLHHQLVDELFMTVSPNLVGGAELGITTGPALRQRQAMKLVWALEDGGHLFLRYARR